MAAELIVLLPECRNLLLLSEDKFSNTTQPSLFLNSNSTGGVLTTNGVFL
jgi:hypothetical protein